jgi:hypothetical protein
MFPLLAKITDNLTPSQSDYDQRRVDSLTVKDAHLSAEMSHRINNMCGKAIKLRLMPMGTEIAVGVNESVPFHDGMNHEENLVHTTSVRKLRMADEKCYLQFEVDGFRTIVTDDCLGTPSTSMGCHQVTLGRQLAREDGTGFSHLLTSGNPGSSRPNSKLNARFASDDASTPRDGESTSLANLVRANNRTQEVVLVDAPMETIFLVVKIEKDSSGQIHVNLSSPFVCRNMTNEPIWLAACISDVTMQFEILAHQTLAAPLQFCAANTKLSVAHLHFAWHASISAVGPCEQQWM